MSTNSIVMKIIFLILCFMFSANLSAQTKSIFDIQGHPTVDYCRNKGIKIVPWTVNAASDLEALKKFNLDGIITDYAERAIRVFSK